MYAYVCYDIDFQVNSCRTKEVFLEETLLKKGFFQTIFPKLLISYCNLISGNLYLYFPFLLSNIRQ
jgi:hypothetical protein